MTLILFLTFVLMFGVGYSLYSKMNAKFPKSDSEFYLFLSLFLVICIPQPEVNLGLCIFNLSGLAIFSGMFFKAYKLYHQNPGIGDEILWD